MKHKILIPLLLIFSVLTLKAQDISKQNFQQAYQEIASMLEGKQPLDFEKAVFLTENAYRDNSLTYEDFKAALDVHSTLIGQLIKNNDIHDWKQFVRGNMGIAPDMQVEAKERYRKALANYAIFTYLTDTLTIKLEGHEFLHLPYSYSNDDPFGTVDWKNSQTIHLLETQKGNCYSLVTLFKIFSERFKSEANIATAPQHIYIEHRDPKGSRFNVEVATRSFPDFGSIQTLTYTTREALLNDISMRKLDLKQSIGLCLVYLAKGYEYKNKINDDEFILTCANTALQHDSKNLNALLLKAQVYEQRVMKKQMPSAPYEKMLADFYKLGYRQMPDDMKEIILSKIQGRPSTVTPINKTPNTFEGIGEQARVVTLSNGLFEEMHPKQKIVKYGQTIFDTEKSKIVKLLDEDISSYQVDPVVFALSVDPLTKSFPMLTPYQFAGNTPIQAIDLDGLEPYKTTNITPVTPKDGGSTKPMTETVVHYDIYVVVVEPWNKINGKEPANRIQSNYNLDDVERIRTNLSKEFNSGTIVKWRGEDGQKQKGLYYGKVTSGGELVGGEFNVYPFIVSSNQNFTAADIDQRVKSMAIKASDGTDLYPAFMFKTSDASKVFPNYTKGVDHGLTIGPFVFMTNEISSNEGHEVIIHYSMQRAGADGEHDLGDGNGLSKSNTSSPGSFSQTEVGEVVKDVKTKKNN